MVALLLATGLTLGLILAARKNPYQAQPLRISAQDDVMSAGQTPQIELFFGCRWNRRACLPGSSLQLAP